MAKRSVDTEVISNTPLNIEYFILRLSINQEIGDIKPGQFVQVRVDDSRSTFLRRPISVYDVDNSENSIHLLIKIAGEGTLALSHLKPGSRVNLLMPLGNSFTIPPEGSRSLLVGGGVGVAPLYLLGKMLKERGLSFNYLLGYRSSSQVIEQSKFRELADLHITTEDGTEGVKGVVTDHPLFGADGFTNIFCCGPDPMMRAVAALAFSKGIDCEVSLENMMACGIGVCLCCVEPTVRGNVNTCTEGPVFNIKELKWQI